MAIHVDVFFIVGLPSDKAKQEAFINKAHRCMNLRLGKFYEDSIVSDYPSKLIKMASSIRRIIYRFIRKKSIDKKEAKLLYKYPIDSSSYWFTYGLSRKIYPKYLLESTMDVCIGDTCFNALGKYDDYLKITYGDWKSYLPIKERFEEFYKMKKIVEERQKFYEQQQSGQ